jgi:hypothetical protein
MTRAPASIRFNRDNWLRNRFFYQRCWRLQLTNKSIPSARQCLLERQEHTITAASSLG